MGREAEPGKINLLFGSVLLGSACCSVCLKAVVYDVLSMPRVTVKVAVNLVKHRQSIPKER